ncbi:MAG: F0F1 ATP synthase subunit delta [Puniceicoccales bacterium]|nr:F0F1 ATP synthase subunit delta [Puniceicoccales bacterium]
MRTTKNLSAQARQLLALSRDNATGALSSRRVCALLAVLASTRKPPALRRLLKAFYAAARVEVARGEMRVEHAGALAPEVMARLCAHFSALYKRELIPVPLAGEALVAGVRVRVGDDVYEASARARLDALRTG